LAKRIESMAEREKVLNEVKFWTPLRIASTLIVLGLLAAFGVSSCNSTDTEPRKPPSSTTTNRPTVRINPGLNTLPREVLNAENKAVNGATPIKLSDYSGKVLFINLWATWCGPCRIETPELVKLNKEYQSRGVQMIGLSTEDPDASAQRVLEFMREYDVAIPQSFIIARDGRILKRFVGFNPDTTPPQLKKALEEALVEKG
jgi:thiol-disulfide isomerase/thioredoxin